MTDKDPVEAMSDGGTYDVCCSCGTERLQRAMRQVTASGLFMCLRCEEWERGWEDSEDDYQHEYEECDE